jgi:hypothetical protein
VRKITFINSNRKDYRFHPPSPPNIKIVSKKRRAIQASIRIRMEAIPQKSIKDTGAESSDSMFVSSLT